MSHGAARVGPRMTPLAVTATTAKKSAAPRNAVARGIGQVLGIKPNSAEMSMESPDSACPSPRASRKIKK